MPELIWHLEDLRAGICYQNFYAAKLASRFVKVCLAGTGGDELFAGYPWRYSAAMSETSVEAFDQRYFQYWQRLLAFDDRKKFFSGDTWSQIKQKDTRPLFNEVIDQGDSSAGKQNLSKGDLVNRALNFEYKTFLGALLSIEDRISMAHSMEVRVPFLSNSVIDFATKLPAGLKLSSLSSRTLFHDQEPSDLEGKSILRKAFKGSLPYSVLARKKQGFSPPDGNWYRGPSMDYIKEILLDRVALSRPYFKGEMVESVLQEHFRGERNHRLLIWSLLSLEWLSRHFFDDAKKFKVEQYHFSKVGTL